MEEEIDLRPYIEAIIQRWYWVVGTAVATAVIAFVISSFLPPSYETTSLVAVTEPSQLIQFEAGFDAVQDIVQRPLRAYPELAISDELLQNVLDQVQPSLSEEMNLPQLRNIVTAESGDDISLIRLTVQYGDPNKAALIANTWAELFVEKSNEVYGSTDSSQLTTLENQLEQATLELQDAEDALIEFQGRNRLDIINNEITALQTARASLAGEQISVNLLLPDIDGLRELLVAQQGGSISLAEQLTALSLQTRAFHADNSSGSTPVMLQIGNETGVLTTDNRQEQIVLLNNLGAALKTKLVVLDGIIDDIEPQILSFQTERERFTTEQNRLARERDVAQDAYTALAQRVREEQLAVQDVGTGVRLASKAAVPDTVAGRSRLLITIACGVLGAMLAVLVMLVVSWWTDSD